jgi:hypothetical protein
VEGHKEGYAVKVNDIYGLDAQDELLPDGVHIIVTTVHKPVAGWVSINSDSFGGSILAPQSPVLIERGNEWTGFWLFGGIVGREVKLDMAGRHVTVYDNPESARAEATHLHRVKHRLVSWTN